MRPLATDTHDFPSLRRDGCIYVDKTMFIHRLITTVGTKLFFISRPRRFGKSLTISAIKAIFQGRRELFEGLAIDKTDWSWEKYPVIHFEFNDLTTTSEAEFAADLAHHVEDRLGDAGYRYDTSRSAHENFAKAIESLSAANGGKGVAPEVETTVYNPISVAYTLSAKDKSFKATWATTGRPSMLMNYLKREDVLRVDPKRMTGIPASEFDVAELRRLRPVAMLFQSGYLTIKDYDPLAEAYTLGVPDEEVRRDLCTLMTGAVAHKSLVRLQDASSGRLRV